MQNVLAFFGGVLADLFAFMLPGIGITFGALIVFLFGMPILVKMFKKLMG